MTRCALKAFSLAPCWSVADKYGEDQAYVSVGGRWFSQVTAQLGATGTAIRLSVKADTARQVLVQSCQFSRFLVVRESSVEREQEFVALMELGGGSAERMAAAFRSKLPTIITRFDKAGSIKRLMGRTSDVSLLVEWFSQLGVHDTVPWEGGLKHGWSEAARGCGGTEARLPRPGWVESQE